MRYRYCAVERTPDSLEPECVYHNEDFELAALLCACGCGHRVTLLVPDSHQVYGKDGWVTIHPSISVCDAKCKSHFFIRAGRVEMLPPFSDEHASCVMREQIARHSESDKVKLPWQRRVYVWFADIGRALASLLKGK